VGFSRWRPAAGSGPIIRQALWAAAAVLGCVSVLGYSLSGEVDNESVRETGAVAADWQRQHRPEQSWHDERSASGRGGAGEDAGGTGRDAQAGSGGVGRLALQDDWLAAIWVADRSPMYVPARVHKPSSELRIVGNADGRTRAKPGAAGGEGWVDADIRALICSPEFTWDCGWAVSTVRCESRFDPMADGHEWYEGHLWHFVGLWQIAIPDHHGGYEWLTDSRLNTIEAHLKYTTQGVGAWPNCP